MTDEEDKSPHMVGHVHLKVRDLDRSVDFYTGVLGLEIEEIYDRFAFLSWSQRHHDVALQEVGENAPGPSRGVGLYHAAMEVESKDSLVEVYKRLEESGVQVSPVDHGISKALYFSDPDENGLEVYLDTREENDTYEWRGKNKRFDPFELKPESKDD